MPFTTSGEETEWALFLQPQSPHGPSWVEFSLVGQYDLRLCFMLDYVRVINFRINTKRCSIERWMFSAASVSNKYTQDDETWGVGALSRLSSKLGVIARLGLHPQNVALGYDVGKIIAGCLVIIIIIIIKLNSTKKSPVCCPLLNIQLHDWQKTGDFCPVEFVELSWESNPASWLP